MIERPSQDELSQMRQRKDPLLPDAPQMNDADEAMSNDDHAVSYITAEFSGVPGMLMKRASQAFRVNLDRLTGLRSRVELREKLQDSARFAETIGQSSALILVDIDDFRDVNDTHGQDVGDVCLQQVARHLVSAAGEIGFVARMGEDEFAILLQGHTHRSVCFVLKRIKEAFCQPLRYERLTLRLTGSIGVAVRCDGQSFNPDELIRDAALALDEAKLAGKNCHRTFRRALLANCHEKLEVLRGMRNALAAGELELYYQPKIALEDRAHKGFEALLRWRKPDGRVLTPGSFMTVFQDPSLSLDIGNYVIASAIAQARRWMKARVPFASVAVNLSAGQFRDPQLGHRLLNAIAASDLSPAMIEVEVTEGVFLSTATDAVLHACKVLKQGGVRIAFDDFGTGFASLTHLRDFPVDTIKIDRSFIDQIGQGHNTTVIVNAMIGLAHNLSMSIVAEGVETQTQAEFLRSIRCDAAQGYLFGRPAPAALATQRLESSHEFGPPRRTGVAAAVE
ncbi:MAG: bifunctional diguanylate cyclase/phosphodiesterase [Afipia sp.]|nr:bifunctional diguanylate cyclase/phosphodiesterase [Afipia sp.]